MEAFMLFADAANVSAEGKLNVLGVFNQVYVHSFPARHPQMYIVVKLISELGEPAKKRNFVVTMISDHGAELGRAEGSFQFSGSKTGDPLPEANIIFPINDLVFPDDRAIDFVLLIDDEQKARRRLYVSQITPRQPTE